MQLTRRTVEDLTVGDSCEVVGFASKLGLAFLPNSDMIAAFFDSPVLSGLGLAFSKAAAGQNSPGEPDARFSPQMCAQEET